jgi:hypothetical protein
MTLQEAREDLVSQARPDTLLYKGMSLDNEGNEVADADALTDLISRACIWYAKETYCCYQHSISFVLTAGTAEYDGRSRTIFGARILRPRTVTINGSTLVRRDGKQYGLWTIAELQRERPAFRTLGNAVPTIAVWLHTNKLYLSAPPDGAYTGLNFVEGWTIPDVLVNGQDDDEELPVPEEDQPAVIRLALAFGALPNVAENEAWTRLQANDLWWRAHAEKRRRENLNAFLGRRPRGAEADWL